MKTKEELLKLKDCYIIEDIYSHFHGRITSMESDFMKYGVASCYDDKHVIASLVIYFESRGFDTKTEYYSMEDYRLQIK